MATGNSLYLLLLLYTASLHPDVTDEALCVELCPTADDIWFKTMSLLNNVLCKKVYPDEVHFPIIWGTQEIALNHHNLANNDLQITNAFKHYALYEKLEHARQHEAKYRSYRLASQYPPVSNMSDEKINNN